MKEPSVLHSFSATDGAYPEGGLVVGREKDDYTAPLLGVFVNYSVCLECDFLEMLLLMESGQ